MTTQMTLLELMAKFPDDRSAEAWFAEQRWPDGQPACPRCGSVDVQSNCAHRTMPYRCREKQCAKRFSIKTGTVMQSSKLGPRVWAIAMYILTTGVKGTSSLKMHHDLGVTAKTAWHLAHRIRESWAKAATPGRAEGPAEVDEAYFGGRERNKHWDKKLRAGRGSARCRSPACWIAPRTASTPPSFLEPDEPFVLNRTRPGADPTRRPPTTRSPTTRPLTTASTSGATSAWSPFGPP